jgi:uncharacterized membrane protein YtjA (UPF0391 family)
MPAGLGRQRNSLVGWCVGAGPSISDRATPATPMSLLRWAVIFLIISLIAGGLGLTGISAGAARISKILFIIFGVLFLVVVLVALLFGQLVF